MNGKSSAHQARPITGTQISSCLRKNFSSGMWRFITCCSTKMSTHDWWLQLTRYQPRYGSLATPSTSHSVRWVRRIQPLLQADPGGGDGIEHRVDRLAHRREGQHQLDQRQREQQRAPEQVLITSSSKAMTPRTTGGRNPSMV
jgi:hypothetical protein